jgi:hypothetical protein
VHDKTPVTTSLSDANHERVGTCLQVDIGTPLVGSVALARVLINNLHAVQPRKDAIVGTELKLHSSVDITVYVGQSKRTDVVASRADAASTTEVALEVDTNTAITTTAATPLLATVAILVPLGDTTCVKLVVIDVDLVTLLPIELGWQSFGRFVQRASVFNSVQASAFIIFEQSVVVAISVNVASTKHKPVFDQTNSV